MRVNPARSAVTRAIGPPAAGRPAVTVPPRLIRALLSRLLRQ
ncbi:hypothetical protein [Streptomyces sp. CAU 1734]